MTERKGLTYKEEREREVLKIRKEFTETMEMICRTVVLLQEDVVVFTAHIDNMTADYKKLQENQARHFVKSEEGNIEELRKQLHTFSSLLAGSKLSNE